ncbi:MAG TPA: hypothetical protein PLK99_09610 [Burkholderiales bacterium]|nr:hypothetical protein [Burkholderiales bacterium]
MEEKLKESIQPKRPAREKPQPKSGSPGKAAVKEADLNAPDIPLHPNRVWPD